MNDYSFSGADSRAYAYFDGVEENIVELTSVHTISISINERKGMARSLGYRGIRGMARGVRTIGGSIIFTVVQDHPLRKLIETSLLSPYIGRMGWSVDRDMVGVGTALNQFDFTNRLPTLLPPFNVLVKYVSEMAAYTGAVTAGNDASPEGAALLIKGMEFIDEGHVTSVNDIVSEISYSWVAMDLKPLSKNTFTASNPSPLSWDPFASQATKQQLLRQSVGQDFYPRPHDPHGWGGASTSVGGSTPWNAMDESEQNEFRNTYGVIKG